MIGVELRGILGVIFKTRQSSSTALLHELGHLFYKLVDPMGEIASFDAKWEETLLLENESDQEAAQDNLLEKRKKELGDYHRASDRWLIQKVEPATGEGERKNHTDGYFLKTRGGTFSTRGRKIGKKGVKGTIRKTKANSTENGGDGKIK